MKLTNIPFFIFKHADQKGVEKPFKKNNKDLLNKKYKQTESRKTLELFASCVVRNTLQIKMCTWIEPTPIGDRGCVAFR